MALVNDHVTDASEKRLGGTGAESGSTQVARSGGSAQGQDLDFITKNNKLDAEYQLPVTADAKATWVGCVVLQPEPNLPRIHSFQLLLPLFLRAVSWPLIRDCHVQVHAAFHNITAMVGAGVLGTLARPLRRFASCVASYVNIYVRRGCCCPVFFPNSTVVIQVYQVQWFFCNGLLEL